MHVASETHGDRRSLRDWEALLGAGAAERLDRSTLVRPASILAVKPFGRGAKITFRNSPLTLELGRAAAERLHEILAVRQ